MANEDNRCEQLFAEIGKAREAKATAQGKLSNARSVAEEEERAQARSRDIRDTPAAPARRTASVSVGREQRTYHEGNDPQRTGAAFITDVCRQFLFNDPEANERLARHMAEERVERGYQERSTTANWAGLVVPQYLTDLVAPATAALRPLADNMNRHPLPPNGMSVNVSRVTTASSAALQATELTGVSNTDMDDTLLTVNVQTAAGQQTVSRQAIERGTGVEETAIGDLMRRVATVLDSTVINQATTGALAAGQLTTQGTAGATNTYTAI